VAHGQLGVAARANLLVLAALPVAGWAWLDWLVRTRCGRPGRRLTRAVVVGLVVVDLVFAIVRNLPAAGALRP
jgi:hypothetical protein